MNREIYSFTQGNQFLNERNKAVVGMFFFCSFMCIDHLGNNTNKSQQHAAKKRETKARREKNTPMAASLSGIP